MEHSHAGGIVITAASRKIPLQCHSGARCDAVKSVHVVVNREAATLHLRYEIVVNVGVLKIPPTLPTERRDELWRHTCAEAFITLPGTVQYGEFNFSPSSQWAAYHFTGYRQGGSPLSCDNPNIALLTKQKKLVLAVSVALPEPYAANALQMGLCMVIEDSTEQCSYWALRHDSPCADFHRRENWILVV